MNKLPKINIDELESLKKRNFKDRLKFIDDYSKWIKKNKWSKNHKKLIN